MNLARFTLETLEAVETVDLWNYYYERLRYDSLSPADDLQYAMYQYTVYAHLSEEAPTVMSPSFR
jgi:hypothetical protein